MLVNTVSQLIDMSDGAKPEAFRGKITKVYPRKPFKSKEVGKPDYTIQMLVITDGKAQIELKLWSREEVSRRMEGSQLYAIAGRSDRGIGGLVRKDNNYQGKTTPQISVYESPDLSFEDGSGQPVTPPAQQQEQAPPPNGQQSQQRNDDGNQPPPNRSNGRSQPADSEPAPQGATKESIAADRAVQMKLFDKRVAKTTAAYHRCVDAAFKAIADLNKRHGTKFEPTIEIIEKMAMGFMVNACWTMKPADIENFPMKPFQSYEQPATNGNTNTGQPERQGQPFN
jgi:hypothetical protein